MGDEAFCPQCGANRAVGAAFCAGCGRQWDALQATSTKSAEAVPASLCAKRGLILVGLFILSLPGWVVGGYLILKWTGLIRGMSHENEVAAGWSSATFTAAILALAMFSVLTLPYGESAAEVGAAQRLPWLVIATVAAAGAFYIVKTRGAPQVGMHVEWKGFAIGATIAIVGISISIGSYDAAAKGGGSYVVAWGAVLVGGLMALRSLRRPAHVARPPLSVERGER